MTVSNAPFFGSAHAHGKVYMVLCPSPFPPLKFILEDPERPYFNAVRLWRTVPNWAQTETALCSMDQPLTSRVPIRMYIFWVAKWCFNFLSMLATTSPCTTPCKKMLRIGLFRTPSTTRSLPSLYNFVRNKDEDAAFLHALTARADSKLTRRPSVIESILKKLGRRRTLSGSLACSYFAPQKVILSTSKRALLEKPIRGSFKLLFWCERVLHPAVAMPF